MLTKSDCVDGISYVRVVTIICIMLSDVKLEIITKFQDSHVMCEQLMIPSANETLKKHYEDNP